MKTTGLLALLCTMALTGLPAIAGYRSLVDSLETYAPPPLYQTYARPAPAVEVAPLEPNDFREQVRRLQAAKAAWETALDAAPPEGAFFAPDPARFEALKRGTETDVAEEALRGPYSLETLEVLALIRNPGVKAAERTFRGTLERYNQAWNLDEVLRQYSAFTEALMTGVGPMVGREPIDLKFPFPGVLALKGEIVGKDIQVAKANLEIARRAALTGARKAYWNLSFVHRAREITGEMLSLLQHLEAVATSRYETGATSFQDVIKVRIQRETMEEDLVTLRERQHTAEAKIREILNLPFPGALGRPEEAGPYREVPELEPLYALSLERRQELARTRAMVGKMERMIEMAETRMVPAYSLNLSLYQDEAVTQVGTFRMKEPFPVTTTASVGAGLPKMPWFGSSDAYLRETRQKLEALRNDLDRAESQTLFGVREAWFRLDQAAREEALFARSIVDLSQAALEVSTRGYETGRVGFADVISSYTNWLNAHLALTRKRSDLGIARAEIEEAVGVSPLATRP
ncbi:MAG: TolC family protein [Deferrisomatales bacterium]